MKPVSYISQIGEPTPWLLGYEKKASKEFQTWGGTLEIKTLDQQRQ